MSTTYREERVKGNNIQRGFSLVSAIFLLVVLAALGAAMVTFSTAQNQGLAMDVMGSRAYQAANAGVEWAAYNIATTSGVPVVFGPRFVPATPSALGGNLAPFTVWVGYTAVARSDAADSGSAAGTLWTYDIAASAVFGVPGSADYVERVINAKM
jgi:MSHA biogenesis protein MshP